MSRRSSYQGQGTTATYSYHDWNLSATNLPTHHPLEGEALTEFLQQYPDDIEVLDLHLLGLKSLPSLKRFHSLKRLDISGNQLQELPELPEGLDVLICSRNKLSSLRNTPSTVTMLIADCNRIQQINHPLPSVKYLCVPYNQITFIQEWPPTLDSLTVCYNLHLTALPPFPDTLLILYVNDADLDELPVLPPSLMKLYCGRNRRLSRLPRIPESLVELQCTQCRIASLPRLPEGLRYLGVADNPIGCMENIPTGLEYRIALDSPLGQVIAPRMSQFDAVLWRQELRRNLQTLNRFRELYYTMKYKRQFWRWMWNKSRIARIERDNHPDRLRERLEEEGEEANLEDVLHRLWVGV